MKIELNKKVDEETKRRKSRNKSVYKLIEGICERM